MNSLTEVPREQLKIAQDATETLITQRAYLTTLLVVLLTKFRDDVSEALGASPGEKPPLPQRGRDHHSLDEMTSTEFDAVTGAADTLRQDRFTRVMDDPGLPRLLREFDNRLTAQKLERAQLRAEVAS